MDLAELNRSSLLQSQNCFRIIWRFIERGGGHKGEEDSSEHLLVVPNQLPPRNDSSTLAYALISVRPLEPYSQLPHQQIAKLNIPFRVRTNKAFSSLKIVTCSSISPNLFSVPLAYFEGSFRKFLPTARRNKYIS